MPRLLKGKKPFHFWALALSFYVNPRSESVQYTVYDSELQRSFVV